MNALAKDPHRVFFALWPTQSIAEALVAAIPKELSGRRMQVRSLHLTLVFVGNVSAAQLQDLLVLGKTLTPSMPAEGFDLRIDRLDYWRHNRIVWAGISQLPSGFTEWAVSVRAAIQAEGFAADPQPFLPHLTLMRKVEKASAVWLEEPIDWTVRDWCLVQSLNSANGPCYEVSARWSTDV